jgi:hypothetical protein
MSGKRIIEEEVAYTHNLDPINLGDIKDIVLQQSETKLLDSDIIIQAYDEEANAYDVSVLRNRPETDKEVEARVKRDEATKRMMREQRRNQYLKLKEEFENE